MSRFRPLDRQTDYLRRNAYRLVLKGDSVRKCQAPSLTVPTTEKP